MPKPYPSEFRDDVVRVAQEPRARSDDRADRERLRCPPDDVAEVVASRRRSTRAPSPARPGPRRAELREARKRIRLLEQENEVLRRAAAYLSQANLPGKGSTRS